LRPDKRIRITREPQRGRYDRETIDAILDEALLCHLGFEVDGQPYVIPTLHARVGDIVYVHGSAASRMLKQLAGGVRVCLTVTLFDGLVLARSVFNHSVNYRSVVLLGTAQLVPDGEKAEALHALTEQLAPGRWEEARQPTAKELKATWILALPIEEASAKVRSGPPEDDPEDEHLPVWAGVVPVHLAAEPSAYDWQRVHDGRVVGPRPPTTIDP
jgi:nitroimidazol reductase NimA-like FMN-containing flavoprotein (pyridoxamine 5'-phosphate oxidase superfamily)